MGGKRKTLTEAEHYKLINKKLEILMNGAPAVEATEAAAATATPATTAPEPPATPPAPKAPNSWAKRASEYYKAEKKKRPTFTFKDALKELKGKKVESTKAQIS